MKCSTVRHTHKCQICCHKDVINTCKVNLLSCKVKLSLVCSAQPVSVGSDVEGRTLFWIQIIQSSEQLRLLITFSPSLGNLLAVSITVDDLYLHYRIRSGSRKDYPMVERGSPDKVEYPFFHIGIRWTVGQSYLHCKNKQNKTKTKQNKTKQKQLVLTLKKLLSLLP